ncbi:MAG: hypothetical protein PHP73_06860 [Candidatus Omnitrophica bacterium]|nr:hypothetical protein [Candidatus Omnitrophota bacterium]
MEYSTNAFSDELQTVVIAASTDATGTPAGTYKYTWTIPDAISATVRARITNNADTTVKDISDGNFKIIGSFILTAPNGAEQWTVGQSYSITWTKTGSITNAKIEYSTNGGATYPNIIIASTPAGGLSYSWTIPDTISATVKVKISDASDATVFDESNANFTILGGFTVTAPNGGEVWTVNESRNITWNTAGTVANVKLEYSTDGGGTYPNVIIATTPNNNLYAWTVPDNITNGARIKVSDASNANAFDTSNANFKIRGSLTVTAPNGAEAWPINSTQNITWNKVGSITNVKLEYSTNAFSDELQTFLITASINATTGTPYSWLIPDKPSATVKVRISDVSDSTVYDLSNANFSIKGSLWVTSPNGGETWVVGNTNNITWTKFGSIANVELRYSTDGGTTYPVGNIIIASTPASTLTYSWTIPDAISTQLKVKIADAGDASVFDESNANFTIKGSVTVTSPNGGETWIVGENRNITWTRTGSFINVKLEYSTNGFTDELQTTVITASILAAPLTYAWTVPDAIGTNLKVRISDAADATVTDVSNGTFTIKGALTLTAPNGAETWIVGESRNITWNRTGSIANVKLEYSTDAGVSYPNVITASTSAATGTYAWTIPDVIGNQLRVRVTDATDATVFAASAANFTVKGSLTVTAPNGGEAWVVGTSQNITWAKTGTISTVKLEYSTNAFSDELQTVVIAASTDATGTPAGTYKYTWTIPDAISSAVKVRISNTADAAVVDRSDTNFKITGSFTLIAPNGAEQWTVDTVQTINWTRTGSVANAKLEYSTDGGATYPNIIIASIPAGGLSYSWTIPDSVSTACKVKISDASDAGVNDVSNANFAIRGGFAITAPNGGEVWTVGTSQNITWTTTGSVANVKLEYSTDGGIGYPNIIVVSTPNTGTYGWTIPDDISATLKVRISDVNNSQALDVSNNNFKIQGALAIAAPNGAEQWEVATSQNITWTSTGTIANIKLEYSTNGFFDELQTVLITASVPNANTYAWTIPDAISSTVKVRITNVADSTVYDLSNANFTIKGSVVLTAPNGGESWIVGTSYNITWTRTGSIANVKLEYSTNGFSDELQTVSIIASTPAASLSYAWTVPDAIGNIVKVRITDASNATVTDVSNADFSIKGSLTLTAPNGAEIWRVGESRNIAWTKTGSIANVKLEYSTDGGASYPNVIISSSDATTGTYAWIVPDAIGAALRVKITNVADSAVSDVSNANFEIKGSLMLISPNSGEVWSVGSIQPITWSKSGTIADVKLEYSTDGGVIYPNVIIVSTPAAAGSYSWTIPDSISTSVRVKITSIADPAVFDASDANFKIAGSLTLTAPNGGEAWIVGSPQNITWTKTGSIANVKLEYSTDGGASYPNLIAASIDAALGTPYAWTIPDVPSTAVRVKITNTADATIFDASNADFSIKGAFTITSPNGAETWIVGESRNITWIKTGSIANAKLEYSTDGGSNYPNLITASVSAALLSYGWTVPDAIGASLKVKITDVADVTVSDASNTDFTIKGSLTLTSPNGGEVWVVGENRNITWTKTGSIANVKLEYSTDGGASYPNVIISSSDATTGTYAWPVADAIGTTLKVKITNVADVMVNDVSNTDFEIKGSLILTAPNGAETWIVGNNNNITWSRTGSIANVKLEYSADGGLSYPNVIILSTPAAAGSYSWTVPDVIGTTLRVKITNVADATVSDASNANFKIAGSFTITSPNGSEVWIVGESRNISWTKTGSIANAKLEYSTDGGVAYPNMITASIPANLGSYTWTIPDNMSSTVKVRISDVTDPTVLGASNANFKITGSFIITAPNGAEKWPIGSTQAITWTKTGSILNAKLEYSIDGGTSYPYVIIATTPAASLSYNWTVPNTPSITCRVKISDVSDPTVLKTSNADFKIHGAFTLTSPNGGEVWVVGETRNISWNTLGSIANVKLEYSIDGGSTYPNSIVLTTPNTGSYSWTIPDNIGTTLRVRITDVTDPDATAVSAANFKIRGNIIIGAPNGGEAWVVGTLQNITWAKVGTIANVKIEYSTDGGTTYPVENLIAASLDASLGTYAWTIPDAISTTVKVKITNTVDTTVFDDSNNNFIIRGGFTLTSPNGGEKWSVGTSRTITWNTFGTIANVKLEYSTDGGATYPVENVIVASTPNLGSYNWTIPNNISSACKVRVSNAADPGSFDVSDLNFKIMGGFGVTFPIGGEVFVIGSSQNITWTTAGTVANVKLEYSTNGGTSYPNIITAAIPNTNSYTWTVPDAISTTVRVKVSDAADVDAFGASAGNFKIRAGFTLTNPSGGQAWVVASAQNITWTTFGTVDNVKLEYSTDSGATYPNIIIALVLNSGTYAWTIPDAITPAARVRVSDVNDSTAMATSTTNFKIQGSLTITAPVGGEQWTVGSVRTITWDRVGSIPFVKLEFSTDGGTLYAPIVASTANTGSYSWTIPDNISTTVKVRVSDVNDATVNSASAANFKIQAGFTMIAPNGGEIWLVGSSQNITWSTQGTVGFVKLDYSVDGGATFPDIITTSTANTGTYSWTVPDSVSGSVKVRVSNTMDATSYATSNANFRIRTTFTLTSPNGGQQWLVGAVQNITWNTVGTLAGVKLEYSRDGFLTDKQSIAASAAPTGSYAWTIPDAISNTVRVRVSDPNDIGAYKDSSSDFRITARFTVTVPNGAEKWDVGSTQDITWSWAGTVPNVKLEYSTNGGATYPDIIAAAANTGSYTWVVPDTISAQFKIRISDLADATANDVSDANAKIRAKFTVISPNGGEVWTVGASQNITWSTVGTVANVKLDYSTDGGATYLGAITASTANTGTYSWTVPDAISTAVKVRVMSTTDTDAFDASDNDFKIRGALAITSPNGGELWQINLSNNITWNTTGTIPTVKLEYSTDSGSTYPNTIVVSVANTNTYAWLIPDNPTAFARIRITDTADATVYSTSGANFRIQGYFTVTSPNGGEAWIVGSAQSINWSWGGTIPLVKLSYSTDSGTTFPNVINVSAPNGAGGGGNYSYAWTVPDTVSQAARVKIEDPNDNTVFDISNADFKIRGNFVLTSPNGAERWITDEVHAITWATTGTVANVKLQYSKDNFVSDINTIVVSTPNTNTYNWTIPDDRSTTVKVRVLDASDDTVNAVSAANFKIDYYTITWILKDLLTNEQLTNLSVVEKDTASLTTLNWQTAGQTSPVTHQTKYGLWTATWSCSGYGDKAQNYAANSDQTFTLYMETTVIHIWRTYSEFAYNSTGDRLDVSSWLERDGGVVSGAVSVKVDIYDAGVLIKTLTSNTPSEGGFFNLDWAPSGLSASKVYTTVTEITNASGAKFKTPGSFEITAAKRLEEMQTTVNSVLDKPMSQVNADLQATLAAQTATIDTKMTEQTNVITQKTDEMKAAIDTSLSSFETKTTEAITKLQSGADKAVSAGATLEATAKRFSWQASVSPDPALTDDTITLSCQGQPGLFPVLVIYSWDNKTIVDNVVLKDTSGQGLYTYEFEADSRFTAGKAYTYVITEQSTGGMVSGSGMVESMGITTVAGLAAAAPEAERAAKQALDAIQAVETILGSKDNTNISLSLKNLKESIDRLPETIAKEGPSVRLTSSLNEISERVKKLAGDEGYNMNKLLEQAISESPTVKDIRGKTEAINSVIDLLMRLFEAKFGGIDAPIISTSLQPGSVKFRIVAMNPSKVRAQSVEVKYNLPSEVKPKDIMDTGGLDLEYDSEKSIYYMHKPEFELLPAEVKVYEVEVEDVWVIQEKKLDSLRKRVDNIMDKLQKTPYYEKGKEIADTIYPRLDEIAVSQKDDSVNREQHIGIYRQNLLTLEQIKEDIGRMEKILVTAGGPASPEMLSKTRIKADEPTKTMTWILVFVIIVFIGLLTGVLFFTWHRQARLTREELLSAKESAFPEPDLKEEQESKETEIKE